MRQSHYIQLTTFRKNREGVPTPVWFAEQEGKLYIVTPRSTAKVKRISNNSRVTLAPCTYNGRPTGASIEGEARIMATSEQSAGHRALQKKYGWLYRIFMWFQDIRKIQSIYLEIEPSGHL